MSLDEIVSQSEDSQAVIEATGRDEAISGMFDLHFAVADPQQPKGTGLQMTMTGSTRRCARNLAAPD